MSLGSPTMYADDMNVTFAASNMIDLETEINTELKSVNISLDVAKTEFVVISSRQKLLSLNDKTIDINVDGVKINQTNHSTALGLNMDEFPISKKVASSIDARKRVRSCISMHTAIKIYKGLIKPKFGHFD